MTHRYARSYRGPIKAVILDWAGTAVDHGCLAPIGVFVEVFRMNGVDVTVDEVRGPMGTHKREHIRIMCNDRGIRQRWMQTHDGQAPSESDIDSMYSHSERVALQILPRYATPVPGLLPALAELKQLGIRIGSTTGYNRAMLDALMPLAARHGYAPDCAVAASDVPAGRPAPFMALRAMELLGIYPVQACIHVGDTVVDIEAGLNAGMWSVGVAATGNQVGLSESELSALSEEARAAATNRAAEQLARAGAHLVIESAAQLPFAVDAIEARMRQGECG